MLLIALAWLCKLFLSYTFGLAFFRFIARNRNNAVTPIAVVFTGMGLLSAAVAVISIFSNIGLAALLLILGSAIFFWVLQRPFFVPQWHKLWREITFGNSWVLTAKIIGSICLLLMSVHVPSHGDSDFYHAQAVQWTEQYKVIPGLGNLFGRLAFNSALFPLQALFSFSFALSEPLHLVNSFLIWIFFLWLLNCCNQSYREQNSLLIFFLVLLLGSFLLFRGWVSSVAPDIAAGIFTWAALLIYLQEPKNQPSASNFWAISICSFTAVSIKISTLPVLLLPAILLLPDVRKRNFQSVVAVISAMLILAPFLIRNVIVSGYLLYPVPSVDLFSVDWKIPKELVVQEKNIIHAFARIPGMPAGEVLSLSLPEWFPKWFALQAPHDVVILLLVLLLPVVPAATQAGRKLPHAVVITWAVVYAGIIFWLVNAPSFRFGYGFLVPASGLSIWYLLKGFHQKIIHRFFNLSMVCISLMLVVFALYLTKKSGLQLPERLFSPAPYPAVSTTIQRIGTAEIRIPVADGNCGNAPVPCVNQSLLHPDLRLRGQRLKQGFFIADK